MPIMIPTPEELQRMSWHQRQAAMRSGTTAVEDLRAAYADHAAADFGAYIRAQATALLAAMPADPDAAAHRAALVETERQK